MTCISAYDLIKCQNKHNAVHNLEFISSNRNKNNESDYNIICGAIRIFISPWTTRVRKKSVYIITPYLRPGLTFRLALAPGICYSQLHLRTASFMSGNFVLYCFLINRKFLQTPKGNPGIMFGDRTSSFHWNLNS